MEVGTQYNGIRCHLGCLHPMWECRAGTPGSLSCVVHLPPNHSRADRREGSHACTHMGNQGGILGSGLCLQQVVEEGKS